MHVKLTAHAEMEFTLLTVYRANSEITGAQPDRIRILC